MASWREIDRVRKDVCGARALAQHLLDHSTDDLSPWEGPFLESIGAATVSEFTTRQAEKLLQIRDDVQTVETITGDFSVKILLQRCWEARLDLSDRDEEWIVATRARNPVAIRRKFIGRLARISRHLGLIESEVDA